jgi:beta-lactamase class D
MKIFFSYLLSFIFSLNTMVSNSDLNLQKFFDKNEITGSITIFDYKNKIWIYSSEEDSKVRKLPASTFKIPNSLIFLEEKVLKDENDIVKWDGIKRYNEKWNSDLNLRDAFKYSALWFYMEGSRHVESKTYKKYLEEFSYGNQTVSEKKNSFWVDGSLKISPEEQINFLGNLYEEKFSLSEKTYKTVKDIMVIEKTPEYTLRGKTGWGIEEGENVLWYVGYVETKDNVYFFATRLINKFPERNSHLLEVRKQVTMDILRELKIIN